MSNREEIATRLVDLWAAQRFPQVSGVDPARNAPTKEERDLALWIVELVSRAGVDLNGLPELHEASAALQSWTGAP